MLAVTVAGMFAVLISCQCTELLEFVWVLMILGLMISFFWMTRMQASLSWMPEWFVHEVTLIRLSENRSMPSGHTEFDLIIMLRLFRLKKAFRLSAPKLTRLFCF